MDILGLLKAVFNTILLYTVTALAPMTPGTVIWKLFKTRKGKVRLINRDLICDTETLLKLPSTGRSLDQSTNSLVPFVPLFTLDYNTQWKRRHNAFVHANNKILARITEKNMNVTLPGKQGNIFWDLCEIMFKIAFELVFDRPPTVDEFNDIYPGVVDVNKVIKRFSWTANLPIRQKLYDRIITLMKESDTNFVLHDHKGFPELSDLDKVSLVGEDLITTISIQCSDLLCHLLLLYPKYHDAFKANLDNCINETLRLYPLSDLWIMQPFKQERGWITSLVQLNRNGWSDPDTFLPERWDSKEHPPLMSWGFDVRRCPAQKMATNIVKLVFENIINTEGFWIQPALNFDHGRSFPFGCQAWVGYGQQPDNAATWKFNHKFKMQFNRWVFDRLRMFDQNELV
ncbi:unnamed protein product [Didymodactylos carnosus]|uniref:Cytochrome P450 n=1 Tax=Didymodactylos carnosus TaxID=1234261 RepID=A0A814P992_9BILA|nr:unnamed protein product [Didymodactylos carnosus]CAF1100645.1 unnamed protein product [Didymodactylos carnosus]CAF3800552.1 unnamed protein product [Didymodactylos carnosus]CAF3865601.1 unnamed protein product [Didymodactylos carnosus]